MASGLLNWLGSNAFNIANVATNVGSQFYNNSQTQKTNDAQMRWSEHMFNRQGQRELEYFNMQNAYNDPSAQMQRLKAAGLNPHLVYGNGATTQSASASPKSAPSVNLQAPRLDLSSVTQQALMTQQAQANIRRTDAETQAILSRTVNQDFLNKVQQTIGTDYYVRNYATATNRLETSYARESADYNAWSASSFAGKPTDDRNSPLAKAYAAGLETSLQQLKNLVATGDAIGFQNEVKAFEARLAKQGISPNSPWWTKLVGDLLQKALPSLNFGLGGSLHAPSSTNFKP